MFKKIIPLILASSIVFSCIAPASAADTPTHGEVVNDIVFSTAAEVVFNLAVTYGATAVGGYFGQPQVGAYLGPVIADGLLDYADYIAAGYTDQDIYDQFTNYNANLVTSVGTTALTSNGLLSPLPVARVSNHGSATPQYEATISGNGFTVNGVLYGSANLVYADVDYYVAPMTGYYTFVYDFAASPGVTIKQKYFPYTSRGYVSAGTELIGANSRQAWLYVYGSTRSEIVTASASLWYLIEPADSGYREYFPVDSRPTSLVTPIAIQNSDETYTVYNNITLVDEGNKVVFDPSTGESITFTDWAFDYESRTYALTLDGGGNMTVQFGDDSITMTQGDTVTNIFYVQDPADDPGTDNPDDPDNPGTDADVSGFFAWWKNAWNGFVDRLFTVLDGGDLEVILPGEGGNPEDEEDDGWTVFDLFALIRDALWKIITGVITVVLDGFLGLVDAIASLGDFFDIYDPANPDGIFGVPGGGVELWS